MLLRFGGKLDTIRIEYLLVLIAWILSMTVTLGAGYIFGGNENNKSIAMTSPVAMSLGDSMTMMFMVPAEYSLETLPKPNESRINFQQVPAKTVAAISFGGWSNDEKIENYKTQLIAALDAEGVSYSDRFYFLGYNAPFEVFNRRNEVIVELD